MQECVANVCFHNGHTERYEQFDLRWVYEGESLYEVLKIEEGIPLFLEDHLERLHHTALLRRMALPAGQQTIAEDIYSYIREINLRQGNLKVVINKPEEIKEHVHYLIYQIGHHYPSEEMYGDGVNCLIHFAERSQPMAKVINHRLRNTIYKRLIETAHYEALLVNRQGQITEGSRSNVFFVRNNEIYTAPDHLVLPGISRAKVLDICRNQQIPLHVEPVMFADLPLCDAAFLTGTSIRILPVSSIDDITFTSRHTIPGVLMSAYRDMVNRYIRQHLVS
jgi:branched-chain amino acid aminotransferase